ncbi:hypothetical protein PSP6_1010001 [Paraburkholderia tropica]|nr:hypothetical protein PSP6_1010001 [Paraburkholderia tropica]
MDQRETDEVLLASLRFSPVGKPIAELAATDESEELVKAWESGHPGGSQSIAPVSDAVQYDALRLTDAELAAIRGSGAGQ